ncbi:MAG: hypothetical protein PHV34_21190 [Verrucomicrobiae bacterium]|nr:hypothetical protein [Verrucomicrobiae bacterium]
MGLSLKEQYQIIRILFRHPMSASKLAQETGLSKNRIRPFVHDLCEKYPEFRNLALPFSVLKRRSDLEPIFEEYRNKTYKDLKARLKPILGKGPQIGTIRRLYLHWGIVRPRRFSPKRALLAERIPNQGAFRRLWSKHKSVAALARELSVGGPAGLTMFLRKKGWLAPPKAKGEAVRRVASQIPSQARLARLLRRFGTLEQIAQKLKLPRMRMSRWIRKNGWQTPQIRQHHGVRLRIKRLMKNNPSLFEKFELKGSLEDRFDQLIRKYPSSPQLADELGVAKTTFRNWLYLGRKPKPLTRSQLVRKAAIKVAAHVFSVPLLKNRLNMNAGRFMGDSDVTAYLEELGSIKKMGRALLINEKTMRKWLRLEVPPNVKLRPHEREQIRKEARQILARRPDITNRVLAEELGLTLDIARRFRLALCA